MACFACGQRSRGLVTTKGAGRVLAIAMVDIKRILSSRLTWVLLGLALIIVLSQTLLEASGRSFALSPVSLDTSGFAALLENSPPTEPVPVAEIVGREVPPTVRLMASFAYLDSLVMTAMAIFGGFFAIDAGSGYDIVRRSHGVSATRLFLANAVSVAVASALLSGIGIGFLATTCFVLGSSDINAVARGQMVLQQVFFLPQVAASCLPLYLAIVGFAYTGILTFAGLLGVVAAHLSRGNVVVAAVAPAALIFVAGGSLAAHLPWPFWAFDFENLSFAERFITEPRYLVRYLGGYAIWTVLLLAGGLLVTGTPLGRKLGSCAGR